MRGSTWTLPPKHLATHRNLARLKPNFTNSTAQSPVPADFWAKRLIFGGADLKGSEKPPAPTWPHASPELSCTCARKDLAKVDQDFFGFYFCMDAPVLDP